MRNVVLVTTGGTIASRRNAAGDDVTVAASGGELLGLLPPLPADVAVEVDDFARIGSYNLDLEHAFLLIRRVATHLERSDVAGVVIAHGTDTMEETAFLADLLVASDKPCVFTGAQRDADATDGDGPRNLAQAVQLAASGLTGLGSVIVFEQEFHAARDATKTHAYRTGTFTSMEHGKLGEIDGVRIILHRRPVLRTTIRAERIEPAVDLVKLAMGSDGRFVRCAIATGARGLVIEAFGRGNVTRAVLEAITEAIAAGIVVVISSRCPQGRTQPIYGGDGGGRDVLRAGALFAGDLSAVKTRVALAALLGGGASREEIAATLERIGG